MHISERPWFSLTAPHHTPVYLSYPESNEGYSPGMAIPNSNAIIKIMTLEEIISPMVA